MKYYKLSLSLTLFFIVTFAYAAPPEIIRWVSLSSDARDTVREIIRAEVDKREGFSTQLEQTTNLKDIEDEKEQEDFAYKSSIIAANREFAKAKKKRDDATTQFQVSSTELDEYAKSIKTIRATIENLENQIERYQQDIATQQASLKSWLQTEKHGEILVAVIYTRGFKDSAHELESSADQASAPLIAQNMGTYIQSFSKMINNVLTIDFISATEEGTAKWNNEAPLRFELTKDSTGTTYLRLKRYELYPFQDNKSGRIKAAGPSVKYKVGIVTSRKDLDSFLINNQLIPNNYDLSRFDNIIKDTSQSNAVAEENLNEQIKTFQDRINILREKISTAQAEKESQKIILTRKEESFAKSKLDVAAIKNSKEIAEQQFQDAQLALQEKKKTHESIIIKTALATTRGSQTPAEASAESILDKLAEVKNDAKTQHSSSTTEVTNFKVSGESSAQAITEAKIIAVRLVSFINEGDSVRVNMAFRVRTVLEEKTESDSSPFSFFKRDKTPKESKPQPAPEQTPEEKKAIFTISKNDDNSAENKPVETAPSAPASNPQPAAEKPREKVNIVKPFKRTYRPIATKEALGCLFDLRSFSLTKEGIKLVIEVINTDNEMRSVAFYDSRFGSWTKSKLYDETEKFYDTKHAYVIKDNQKKLMYDIDSRGHGVAIQPQISLTMELMFVDIPHNVKNIKINLHPFIYYGQGWGQKWQEFDLSITNLRLNSVTPRLKALPAKIKEKR